MTRSTSLKVALNKADRLVRQYVTGLEAQNAKLQREIANLESGKVTSKNRIIALEKQLKKGPIQNIKVSFVTAEDGKPA